MEANEETYRLFDNYLSGNLSEQEKVVFEKTLSENELLRDEFIWMSSAVNSIRMSGNQIFKKQMAEIGMGIPASAFEKYSPSIKPKNFFRKYWWAIAATSAIVVAVTCCLIFVHQKQLPESEMNVVPTMLDSAKKQDSLPVKTDSCVDSPAGTQPQYDQAKLDDKIKDVVNDSMFSVVDGGCRTFGMSVFRFSGNKFYDQAAEDSVPRLISNSYSASIAEKISVTFCRASSSAPCYTYAAGIRIYGPYFDTTKITLIKRQEGEIIMTDGKPGYFTLTKGTEAKALVREFEGNQHKVGLVKPPQKMPKKKSVDNVSRGASK